jgi:23S rRNA (cytosine1962-C5)-methyltransferase
MIGATLPDQRESEIMSRKGTPANRRSALRLPVVAALPAIRASLQQGHPWVYRNQLLPPRGESALPRLPSGTWVRVLCGPFESVGLWDAEGAIAVRLFGRGEAPDAAWIAARVREAWDLRAPLRVAPPGRETDAYRWIYGESDGLPGVVVDLYGRYVAVSFYSQGAATLWEPLWAALRATTPIDGVVVRRHGAGVDEAAGGLAWGALPKDLVVRENGLGFAADLLAGQKTELYLDHRENRAALEAWCQEREVLNCFAYTGAFSVYAARGGARQVTSVDLAAAAIAEARRNFTRNGYDPAEHEFVAADCFAWLAECARSGRRFDVVILDPPSMAHDRAGRHAAARAYTRLNRLALGCLRPGGLLASASCTAQVSPEAFREALAAAAAAEGVRLAVIHEAGHALDHPVAAHFPEGRYLKFVLARMLPAL